MNDVLLLETDDQPEESLCLLAEVTGRRARARVGNTTARPIIWDHAQGVDVRFDLERVVRSDRAAPDDGEKAFHRLMARGAALKAESVAVIEQAHRVQAQSRVLRVQSACLVGTRLF
jgi:hypothetical protein